MTVTVNSKIQTRLNFEVDGDRHDGGPTVILCRHTEKMTAAVMTVGPPSFYVAHKKVDGDRHDGDRQMLSSFPMLPPPS